MVICTPCSISILFVRLTPSRRSCFCCAASYFFGTIVIFSLARRVQCGAMQRARTRGGGRGAPGRRLSGARDGRTDGLAPPSLCLAAAATAAATAAADIASPFALSTFIPPTTLRSDSLLVLFFFCLLLYSCGEITLTTPIAQHIVQF